MVNKTETDEDIALVVTPAQACEMLSCGKDTLFKLLRKRVLASYREGRARKIEVASIRAYVKRKLAEAEMQR